MILKRSVFVALIVVFKSHNTKQNQSGQYKYAEYVRTYQCERNNSSQTYLAVRHVKNVPQYTLNINIQYANIFAARP